jgi:hypothetical protein
MNNRDKLVLLADGLDSKGFAAGASLIDEIIVKRSFDEGTRGDIDSVIGMINQYIEELLEATRGEEATNEATGQPTLINGLPEEHRDLFEDKLVRINEAVLTLKGLNSLGDDDDDIGMGEGPPPEGPADEDAGENEDTGEDEDAGESGDTPWWNFWDKEKEEPSGRDEEGFSPVPDPNMAPDDDGEFDPQTGTVRRTRGGGITVEQSMSNIGNVNITDE